MISHQPLMSLISGVYDDIPSSPVYPYVAIGEAVEQSWDDFQPRTGKDVVEIIHVYGDSGFRQCKSIQEEIDYLLEDATFPVNGWYLEDSSFFKAEAIRPETPGISQIKVQYSMKLKKI